MDYQSYKGITVTDVSSDLDRSLESLERLGYFIVPDVFEPERLDDLRGRMDAIWQKQQARYGSELLQQIGDFGVLRGMMCDDPVFFDLLTHPIIAEHVAATVGDTAILHLQNGILLFPSKGHNQGRYHRDFPKDFIPSRILSFNSFIAVDEFTDENGGTWIVPGSHRVIEMPSQDFIAANEIQLTCPAGSIVFFDSMLWHRGGWNQTEHTRRAINQQFTRPFIKQQLDYPVMLGDKVPMESKLAQTLGMWSIPPKSVDQYRVSDPALRTYRGGQG